MKRTFLAMTLLVTSMFTITGCGSDDDVQVESLVKNGALGLHASDGPSEADCEFLDRIELDLLDRLYSLDLRDRLDDLRRDLRLALRDRCDAASKTGNYAPKGNDVDGG
ncbi:MAG: hypothetical protein GWP30_04555 [Actinobacteria bacterium]|nr:hypothetical protein [Actinomycetota bacterium]